MRSYGEQARTERPAAARYPGPEARALLFASLVALVTALGLLYVLSAGFRSEANTAVEMLGRGDVDGLRDYIASFGLWVPAASCSLMILQALVAPVPSFLVTFANGLAFGVFWGWVLSLFGHVLAATVYFGISRARGRAPVEAIAGKTGLEVVDRWFARWGSTRSASGGSCPGWPSTRSPTPRG